MYQTAYIYFFYLLKTLPCLKLSRSLLLTWLPFNVAGSLRKAATPVQRFKQTTPGSLFFKLAFFSLLIEKALGTRGV